MSSTFGGLNTAASGLYAAQRGIDVTGQNVSNVNTDGYSRERLDLRSVGASVAPAIWSTSTAVGNGVNSDTVTRISDAFLQGRAQSAHATSAQLTVQNDALTQVQQTFGEPSDTGMQSQLAAVWSAWQDVAAAPGTAAGSTGAAAGAALLSTTQAAVDGLHSARASLDTQWNQTRSNLQVLVSDVNSTAASIATLNQKIQLATATGQSANSLSDQRDSLVLHLSEQIGATASPADNGMVDVVVGGVSIVSGIASTQLSLAGPTDEDDTSTTPVAATDPNFMTTGLPRIVTTDGHTTAAVGGTAAGQLDTLNDIIPTYRSQLDGVASTLAGQVNAQQALGYDSTGQAGTPMFGSTSGPVTAASITLLMTDPGQIAASSVAPDAGGTAAVDGGNADAMGQLGIAAGSPDGSYRSMITQLGVQGSSVSRSLAIQATVTSTADASVQSVSGVSLDEEMTNMLAFQQSYAASAKLITVINQNLDSLMNMVGN